MSVASSNDIRRRAALPACRGNLTGEMQGAVCFTPLRGIAADGLEQLMAAAA